MQRIRKRKSHLTFIPTIDRLSIEKAQPVEKLEPKNFHLNQSKQATQAKDDLFSFNNFFSCELFQQQKLIYNRRPFNENISSWNGISQDNYKRQSKITHRLIKTECQKEVKIRNSQRISTSFAFLPEKSTPDHMADQRNRVIKTASDWLEKCEKINDEIKQIRNKKTRAKSLHTKPHPKLIQFTFHDATEKQKKISQPQKRDKEMVQAKTKLSNEKNRQIRGGKWFECKDNFAKISRIYNFWQ